MTSDIVKIFSLEQKIPSVVVFYRSQYVRCLCIPNVMSDLHRSFINNSVIFKRLSHRAIEEDMTHETPFAPLPFAMLSEDLKSYQI